MAFPVFSCLLPTVSTRSVANRCPSVPPAVLLPLTCTMAKLPERGKLLPDRPVHWTLAVVASPWRVVDSGFWVSSAKVTLRRWWGRSGTPDGGEVALRLPPNIPIRGGGNVFVSSGGLVTLLGPPLLNKLNTAPTIVTTQSNRS